MESGQPTSPGQPFVLPCGYLFPIVHSTLLGRFCFLGRFSLHSSEAIRPSVCRIDLRHPTLAAASTGGTTKRI
ncbi:hypothetical protein VTH06DRAFT_8120 [Thermothelomyces fergusii]